MTCTGRPSRTQRPRGCEVCGAVTKIIRSCRARWLSPLVTSTAVCDRSQRGAACDRETRINLPDVGTGHLELGPSRHASAHRATHSSALKRVDDLHGNCHAAPPASRATSVGCRRHRARRLGCRRGGRGVDVPLPIGIRVGVGVGASTAANTRAGTPRLSPAAAARARHRMSYPHVGERKGGTVEESDGAHEHCEHGKQPRRHGSITADCIHQAGRHGPGPSDHKYNGEGNEADAVAGAWRSRATEARRLQVSAWRTPGDQEQHAALYRPRKLNGSTTRTNVRATDTQTRLTAAVGTEPRGPCPHRHPRP